jgi:hypothetical protein
VTDQDEGIVAATCLPPTVPVMAIERGAPGISDERPAPGMQGIRAGRGREQRPAGCQVEHGNARHDPSVDRRDLDGHASEREHAEDDTS